MASNLWSIEMSFDLDDCLSLAQNTTLRVSAAAASAAALPTAESTPEDDVCSVCMVGFGSGHTNKRVPCGHVYHQLCIAQWTLHQNSCPLCRSKIFFS